MGAGPQEAPLVWLLAPPTPLNSEIALWTLSLPHSGHSIVPFLLEERTSNSNFSPHSSHWYSYMGISLITSVYTILGYSITGLAKMSSGLGGIEANVFVLFDKIHRIRISFIL